MLNPEQLLAKYDTPVPRYTSYPTVPYWEEIPDPRTWERAFLEGYGLESNREGISLYLHLPFCESLCTYCGCNKKITTNHDVEEVYTSHLLKEWRAYRYLMGEPPLIRELHLGGGTPTFFAPAQLRQLLEALFQDARIHPQPEFSFEGHPNNTSEEHLKTLYQLGFRRVSYGVQDNDPVVQRAINRIQPLEHVQRAADQARKAGYTSVNFDLIYGLPFQTLEGEERTLREILAIRPDRIAFYSYAHVPWKQKAQRLFDEQDLPAPDLKLRLYTLAQEKFREAGYTNIGMDHFALPGDDLQLAWKNGTLHRNFMGYTTTHTEFLLGLGVSAISDLGMAYGQNHKELLDYYRLVREGIFPVQRGIFLDETDRAFKRYILDIACRGTLKFQEKHRDILAAYTIPRLEEQARDGLIRLFPWGLEVTGPGRLFIRNICQAFDLKWIQSSSRLGSQVFSRSV